MVDFDGQYAAAASVNCAYPKVGNDLEEAHLDTTMKVIIREDGSTFHTYFFDTKTGEPIYGKTHQGAGDDSIWARGQSWGGIWYCSRL